MSLFGCCSTAVDPTPIPISQLTHTADRKKAAIHYLRTHPGVDNNNTLDELDWNSKTAAASYMLFPLCMPCLYLCMRYKANSKVSTVINRAANQGVMVDVTNKKRYVGINFDVIAAPSARLTRGTFQVCEIVAVGQGRYEV